MVTLFLELRVLFSRILLLDRSNIVNETLQDTNRNVIALTQRTRQ